MAAFHSQAGAHEGRAMASLRRSSAMRRAAASSGEMRAAATSSKTRKLPMGQFLSPDDTPRWLEGPAEEGDVGQEVSHELVGFEVEVMASDAVHRHHPEDLVVSHDGNAENALIRWGVCPREFAGGISREERDALLEGPPREQPGATVPRTGTPMLLVPGDDHEIVALGHEEVRVDLRSPLI